MAFFKFVEMLMINKEWVTFRICFDVVILSYLSKPKCMGGITFLDETLVFWGRGISTLPIVGAGFIYIPEKVRNACKRKLVFRKLVA